MKSIAVLWMAVLALGAPLGSVAWSQDQAPVPDDAWHQTSESFRRSGYDYLWSVVQDEVDARHFDTAESAQRYHELIDMLIRVGANYGVTFDETSSRLGDVYQELLTLDNPPPLYAQYRYHSSQPDTNSPDRVFLTHADALLEVAYQMDQAGYPPYVAGATWLKAAEYMGHVDQPEDQGTIARIREHGIERLLQAAALKGVEPKYQEFVAVRVANHGFQYIALPREDQITFCQALLDNKDADPWIGSYSSGSLRVKLAWDSRGYGYASEVSELQWQGFQRHLVKAHRHLTRAWELRPHWPQAATELITATMGHQMRTDRDTAFWFEQAINARTDEYSAYTAFNYDLLPKWHGSIEDLDALAQFIIDRSNEHQNMGRILINTVSTIAGEIEDPYRALESDRYLPHMTRLMLDEVELDLGYTQNIWRFRSLRAVALGNFRVKDYAAAAELLQAGGARAETGWSRWEESSYFRRYATLLGSPAWREVIEGLEALDTHQPDKARGAFLRAKKVLKSRPDEIDPDLVGDPIVAIDRAIELIKP